MISAKVRGAMTGLSGRLIGGFGVVLAILVILIVSAMVNATRAAGANRQNEHTYEVLMKLDAELGALLNIETGTRGYALAGKDNYLEPYRVGQKDFAEAFEALKSLTADNPIQQQRLSLLKSQQIDWLDKAMRPIIAMRQQLDAGNADKDGTGKEVTGKQSAGKQGTGKDGLKPLLAFLGNSKAGMDAMRATLASMTSTERGLLVVRSNATAASERQTRLVLQLGGAAAVLFGMVIAVLIARSVIKPVAQAASLAESIADGRLGNRIVVDRKDELGNLQKAMRRMDERLSEVVGAVRSGAVSVDSAANELAQGNDDLSQRTQEQASSLEETAASMEQMTSTVKQNAENATQANQLAAGARAQAEHGGKIIAQASEAMREIEGSSRQITDIVQLIDEVAFQTNLLALNAAVEAARAGEHGRGFAVVATEVRNLAQRSAAAAKNIKSLISNSVEKVQAGSLLVKESAKALTDIIQSIKNVTDIVAEISAASQEQSVGIEQVNRAVMQMDSVTQQNAALVEEAAAAARAMQEQAASLTQQVRYFQVQENVVVAQAPTLVKVAVKAPSFAPRSGSNERHPVAPAQKKPVATLPAVSDGLWREF